MQKQTVMPHPYSRILYYYYYTLNHCCFLFSLDTFHTRAVIMNTIDSSNDGDYDYDYQIVPPPPSRVINMEDSLDVRDVEPKPPSAAAAGSQLRVVKLLKFIGALVCLGIGIVSC